MRDYENKREIEPKKMMSDFLAPLALLPIQ